MLRIALIAIFAFAASRASAADIHVLTGGATLSVEKALAVDFSKTHGDTVLFATGTAGQVRDRVNAGEAADVVVASVPVIQELTKAGKLVQASPRVLARVGIGVAARTGAPRPDISTAAQFRAAILKAKSITYMDPASGASSGIAVGLLLHQLGIADQMKDRQVLVSSGFSAEKVASGQAEFALQNISEILPVKGVVLVGPLPPALQHYTTYAAGIAAASANPDGAKAFIEYLRTPAAAAQWMHAGMEPVKAAH